jgi:DNA-directed RNA polymerase subunit M/transcription elongation factor TFIIS
MPAAMTDRMILEAAGIECFLYDENMVRLDWMWSNLLGGLKLVVRKKDAEDAAKLLESKPEEKFTVDGVGEYRQERCPKCGSNDVSCDELKKRIAGVGLFLGVPIAVVQRGWNCHSCGHAWAVAEESQSDLSRKS